MPTEQFASLLSFFLSDEHQLITMFISGFLSSTVLPGNSEIVFSTIAGQLILAKKSFFSTALWTLIGVATLSNTLGSLTTYAIGLLFAKPVNIENRHAKWTMAKSEKYGVWVLLFSWLPIVGDLFCGIAGWLRFPIWQSVICIVIGKLGRYLLLTATIYPLIKYVL